MCSSARESWSAQSLSPVVMGLLTTAVTHSSVPPGSNDTEPSTWLSRATRAGGSSSSAAACCGMQRIVNNVSAKTLINFSACFLIFRFSPEPDAACSSSTALLSGGLDLGTWVPMLNYGPHPEPRSIRLFLFVQSGNARPSSLYKTPVPPKSCEQISSRKYDNTKKSPPQLWGGPCRFEI